MGPGWENDIANFSELDAVADTLNLSCEEAWVHGHPGSNSEFRDGLQRETVSQRKKKRKDAWGERKREKGRGGHG